MKSKDVTFVLYSPLTLAVLPSNFYELKQNKNMLSLILERLPFLSAKTAFHSYLGYQKNSEDDMTEKMNNFLPIDRTSDDLTLTPE